MNLSKLKSENYFTHTTYGSNGGSETVSVVGYVLVPSDAVSAATSVVDSYVVSLCCLSEERTLLWTLQ